MAEGKRYYWLKLHDDFFSSKRIKKLRRMAGGDTYLIIYLKMQLLAMKQEGLLKWTGLEDDIINELALDLDEEPDDIRVTLSYLIHCGLAETVDNTNFFLPYAVSNVGSEGSSAKRVREFRERQHKEQIALRGNIDVTQVKQNCNGEIEIDIEKEIDIDIEREKEKKKDKPIRHKYGEYGNVLLSDEDLEKLKTEFPSDWEMRIEKLSSYIESKGAKYKNHLATIRNWARREAEVKPGEMSEEEKRRRVEEYLNG